MGPCIARMFCAIPGFYLENLFRGSGFEKTTVLLPVGGMTLSTGKFCSACNKGKVVYEYVLKYSVTALYIYPVCMYLEHTIHCICCSCVNAGNRHLYSTCYTSCQEVLQGRRRLQSGTP